ncbi:MAG TPA: septal ring lytic transglycosylase RlpA family protein, partial [Coleofasciculaceae cyanobacterium]
QAVHGLATWYGPGFNGARTASGERFNPKALTAAHRTLPFGTEVRVTNLKNGQSVVVRINDRLGDPGVVIDLSSGAAQAISLIETSPVKIEVLNR